MKTIAKKNPIKTIDKIEKVLWFAKKNPINTIDIIESAPKVYNPDIIFIS